VSYGGLFLILPVWALSLLVGLSALRLRRSSGIGFAILALSQGLWMTGLLLSETQGLEEIAKRVIPAGILEGAAFVHAGMDVARGSDARGSRTVVASYGVAGAVALVGAVAPHLIYGADARSAGPLFYPLSAVAGSAAIAMQLFLLRLVREAPRGSNARRRVGALLVASLFGSIGGGGAIVLHVFGLVPLTFAGPPMAISTVAAGYALVGSEDPSRRDLLKGALVYAVLTAALSAVGLTAYSFLLPALVPTGAEPTALRVALMVLITFFAALPLDPLRVLLVEAVGRAVLRAPIGARDLAERIEATEVRADQAERLAAIGTIVSAVAHEIRNPLGVIAAHAKLLERSGASETSVAAIRGQIDRTKRFLDDLLAYSRPRPLAVREVNVDSAVRAACRDARAAFGEGAPNVEQVTPTEVAALADEPSLTDVLRILVTNACIAVRGVADARIEITGRIAGEKVRVTVDDNGPGVPKEIRTRLFEPFVTGRGRDAEHPGTGLGLAIAARHLERVGGSLRYEDREGGGARFVIELPKA